jgi:hypothetical protein
MGLMLPAPETSPGRDVDQVDSYSPDTDGNGATAAVRLVTIELPSLLGITDTAEAGALEALAAADAHVFDDLSEPDARRVAETASLEVIRCDWALVDAADAVTDRAIAVQLDRGADLDDRMGVGLALHRAAALLEGS